MFWRCIFFVGFVVRACWAGLMVLLMVALVGALLSAACHQAGGAGVPAGAFGKGLAQGVRAQARAVLNSLPPTEN